MPNSEDSFDKQDPIFQKLPFLNNNNGFLAGINYFEPVDHDGAQIDIEQLIDQLLDVKAIDDSGDMILHRYARYGDVSSVQWLIERGADVNAKNIDGNTALDIAIQQDNPELIQWLKENGAKQGSEL